VNYARVQASSAGDQADAAQQFSDTADDINVRMSEAVDQLQAASDNARASIQATQTALRVEQRAWVFISAIRLEPLVLNDPFTVQFAIRNEGRTPATSRKEGKVFMMISLTPVDRLKDVPGESHHKLGVLFPGIDYGPDRIFSTMGGNNRVVEVNDIAAYRAKPPTLWVYFYGEIDYTDVFGRDHSTSFCAVSNGTDTFGACSEGVYPTYAK